MADQTTGGTVSRGMAGLVAPARGAFYIATHPTLWHLVIIPLFINIVLFILALWTLIPRAQAKALTYVPTTGWSHTLLSPVAHIIAWLVAMLLGAVVVNLLGLIIAPIFNERLSMKVEVLSGRLKAEESMHTAFVRIAHTIFDEITKWFLYFLLMASLLPLWLIPIAGHIAWTVLSSIITFAFLGLEYMDYPMTRRNMRFTQRRHFCWANLSAVLGLGAAVTTCFLIPLVSFLMMPVGVVGGTLLFLDLKPD
jgi:CysZ protein